MRPQPWPRDMSRCLTVPSLLTYLSYRHATFLPYRQAYCSGTTDQPAGQGQVSRGSASRRSVLGAPQDHWEPELLPSRAVGRYHLLPDRLGEDGTGGSQAVASRREMFVNLQVQIDFIGAHASSFQTFFLQDISPFCGATDAPVFYCRLPRVGPLACMCPRLRAMDCSDSPLVQHLLTSWRSAWRLNRFDGRTSVHTLWGEGGGGLESGMFIDWTSLFLIFVQRVYFNIKIRNKIELFTEIRDMM